MNMKKSLFLSIFIMLVGVVTFAQTNNTDTVKNKKITKACQRPIENKTITLCNILVDTLTYLQLKGCNELVVNYSRKQSIDSYILEYKQHDGSFITYQGTGNLISSNAIDAIISSKIDKIIIEEVYGTEGGEFIVLGHRWYYFK